MQTEIDDGRSHTQQSDDEDARPGPADCRVRHKEKEREREREREREKMLSSRISQHCPVLSCPFLLCERDNKRRRKRKDLM